MPLSHCGKICIKRFIKNFDVFRCNTRKHSYVKRGKYVDIEEVFSHQGQGEYTRPMLLEIFKNIDGCVLNTPRVVLFWRFRHGCNNISGESEQHSMRLVLIVLDHLNFFTSFSHFSRITELDSVL